ncbi:hypothetical protein L3Q82_020025, partial [Scortum barcoo]
SLCGWCVIKPSGEAEADILTRRSGGALKNSERRTSEDTRQGWEAEGCRAATCEKSSTPLTRSTLDLGRVSSLSAGYEWDGACVWRGLRGTQGSAEPLPSGHVATGGQDRVRPERAPHAGLPAASPRKRPFELLSDLVDDNGGFGEDLHHRSAGDVSALDEMARYTPSWASGLGGGVLACSEEAVLMGRWGRSQEQEEEEEEEEEEEQARGASRQPRSPGRLLRAEGGGAHLRCHDNGEGAVCCRKSGRRRKTGWGDVGGVHSGGVSGGAGGGRGGGGGGGGGWFGSGALQRGAQLLPQPARGDLGPNSHNPQTEEEEEEEEEAQVGVTQQEVRGMEESKAKVELDPEDEEQEEEEEEEEEEEGRRGRGGGRGGRRRRRWRPNSRAPRKLNAVSPALSRFCICAWRGHLGSSRRCQQPRSGHTETILVCLESRRDLRPPAPGGFEAASPLLPVELC